MGRTRTHPEGPWLPPNVLFALAPLHMPRRVPLVIAQPQTPDHAGMAWCSPNLSPPIGERLTGVTRVELLGLRCAAE